MTSYRQHIDEFLQKQDRSKESWETFKTQLFLDEKITMRQCICWEYQINEILNSAEAGGSVSETARVQINESGSIPDRLPRVGANL